ncbi:MAG: thioredoxin fold domain-containing protein [Myxococcota bacterium]
MWWSSIAFAQAPVPAPTAEIRWTRDRAALTLTPAAGTKIAPDAPSSLTLAWGTRSATFEADGSAWGAGFALGELRGASVEGELSVGLCAIDTGECTPTTWDLRGAVGAARRGVVALGVSAPEPHPAAFGPNATTSEADRAFVAARASGKPILLDFSAVWCPPCNQLGAEVLHGPPSEELAQYEVAVVDVDHPSSFALKDRYGVRGYPTLVVVDADGNEKSRRVGYTDRASFLGWLAGAADSTDAADLAKPPEAVDPARAAELGWLRVGEGEHDLARPWLARAEAGADGFELRRLRFALQPAVADLEWLVANAPQRAIDFAGVAPELKATAPDLVWEAVELGLQQARGLDVANALSSAAEATDDEALARRFHAAAAAVVASEMTGDHERDKAFVSWLSHLQEEAGDADGAVKTLRDAVAAYPDEPTFDLSLAPLLTRLARYDEALASADRAMSLAWGDNHLRAALAKAQALEAMGRGDEAKQVAEAELAAQPPAAEELDVRTHRYRQKLTAFVTPPAERVAP